jgi:hypothetical protein
MTSNEMYFDFLFIVDILLLSEKMYSFVKDAKDHLKYRKDMVEISIQLAETIEFDNPRLSISSASRRRRRSSVGVPETASQLATRASQMFI